ncbi:MAG TPA: TetR/AcrR family transcriptional regulator [Ktedonobacteraceae bacterium]|nr:TetR/AcrR family transcriptional regulator [Ktedonobacteraceae bacterium]
MSPRPDVSEERKNQILEAALAVFARRGFDEARMDDIAQEAGLSKGALYLYYKSKDAIIAAILKLFFNRAMNKLQGFLDDEGQKSAREYLMQLNRYFISEMKWMASLMPISFQFYAIAARQKEVRHFLRQYFKEYVHVLATFIQRGIDRGELRPANAETVAISITALYEGMALLCMVDPHATDWEKTGEDSLRFLLDGLEVKA